MGLVGVAGKVILGRLVDLNLITASVDGKQWDLNNISKGLIKMQTFKLNSYSKQYPHSFNTETRL